MSAPKSITCPSGLRGVVRGLKVKEANLLADNSAAKRNTSFESVLKGIWTETEDAGPYEEPLDWSRVLVCDRFFIMLQSRIITYGSEYLFPVQCTESSCRHRFEWQEDLSALSIRALSEDSLMEFQSGNKFSTTTSAGVRVAFKLMTGADEVRASKLAARSRSSLMTTALAARIVSIEGVEANNKSTWIENLGMDEVRDLLDLLDAVDGGVETSVEIECPACLNVMDLDLPFGREFYLPRLKSRMARKDKAAQAKEEQA